MTWSFSIRRNSVGLIPWHLLAEDAMVENDRTGFAGITLSYNAHSEMETDEVLEEVRLHDL